MEPSTLRPILPFLKVAQMISLVFIHSIEPYQFSGSVNGWEENRRSMNTVTISHSKGGNALPKCLVRDFSIQRVNSPSTWFIYAFSSYNREVLIPHPHRSTSNYLSRWDLHLKSTSCLNASSLSIVRFMRHTTGIMVIGGRGVARRSGMRRVAYQ